MVEELIEKLKVLPKDYLLMIVHELMKDEKLSFTELAEIHNRYLQYLKEEQNERFNGLLSKFMDIAYDKKKNRDLNIANAMHWLLDQGQINSTHERIDQRWKK